jgi:hypothetical protein
LFEKFKWHTGPPRTNETVLQCRFGLLTRLMFLEPHKTKKQIRTASANEAKDMDEARAVLATKISQLAAMCLVDLDTEGDRYNYAASHKKSQQNRSVVIRASPTIILKLT